MIKRKHYCSQTTVIISVLSLVYSVLAMALVTVSEGTLEGQYVQNELAEFVAFKGIPYAAPPVGDLRFKAPQPAKPWSGVRSVKAFGSVCYQKDIIIAPGQPIGSEDCLYLNIYTPEVKPTASFPVMVFIHGGAFRWGSGNDEVYGPEFLVRKGVILVTINYRLEALGFLSLDTEDIPGNAGMKDQVAALRWIKKNISNFGGDPENITIFGESAGGASVAYHLVSPMSKGLFRRAIPMSGCLLNTWAHGFEARERALKLAKQLGCVSEDDKELYEFFKNVPLDKLVDINIPVVKYASPSANLPFGIVSEMKFKDNERFFYGDECDALRNGIHEDVDVMAGYTKDEGLMALVESLTIDQILIESNDFKEFFVPTPIQRNCNIKDQLEAGRKLKKHFMKNNVITIEDYDQFMQFLNLNMFVHGIVLFSKFVSKKNKVFMYKVTCHSERNIFKYLMKVQDVVGDKQVVCHADDLAYIFPLRIAQLNVEKGSEIEKLIDNFTTLWTNFAKFGNPTPDNSLVVKWTPFTVDQQTYLEIGNQLQLKTNPEGDDVIAFDDVLSQFLPSWTVQ